MAHGVEQQARRGVGVVGFFFDAGAGSEGQRLAELGLADAVIQIAQRGGDHFVHVGTGQAGAGFRHHGADARHVQRHHGAVITLDVNLRTGRHRGGVGRGLGGALLGLLVAVDHVGAGNLVFAGAHQAQFDLVLNVFNVQGAAAAHVAGQRLHHLLGDVLDQIAYPRAGGGRATLDGEESLGQGGANFGGVK